MPLAARAQTDADPASSSARPALRVLLGSGTVQTAPGGDGFLFNGRPFRGTFSRTSSGEIVDVVDLEQYLYAVVPHEMPSSWQPGALQAQAICARTYVLQRSNPRREYDVVPSEVDQVYPGAAGETSAGRMAVDATAGQVLRYGSGFASIAYSSCCGGHTESSADAWGGAFFPYLAGVVCPYCSQSPNFRWSASVGLDAVAQHFATDLAPYGALQTIRVAGVDGSGRARVIELAAQRGSAFVKGSAFRLGVGARVVRSLLITNVRTDGGQAVMDGGGLGHGVGLCQWGAQGMALTGRNAQDIVAFYFPGTQVGSD
ncbi:MAG TPA: SpoIID/LytB domain-containing protein [Candidatus Tumulicola sp.]|jgi:stage II sporulation protein D